MEEDEEAADDGDETQEAGPLSVDQHGLKDVEAEKVDASSNEEVEEESSGADSTSEEESDSESSEQSTPRATVASLPGLTEEEDAMDPSVFLAKALEFADKDPKDKVSLEGTRSEEKGSDEEEDVWMLNESDKNKKRDK